MTHSLVAALLGTLCGAMAVTFAFRYWGQRHIPDAFPKAPGLSLVAEVVALTLGALLGRAIDRPWPLLVALGAVAAWCVVKTIVMWVRAPGPE